MIEIKQLGCQQPYEVIWQRMKAFTSHRDETSTDQLWLLEHSPVYTQGQAGKPEHILNPLSIPVIQSDRGGQVTYHGPGQLVVYVLMDIKRRHLGVRTLVSKLEQLLIDLLKIYQIDGVIRCGAPGVYVGEKKIASIGLRVKNGCTYHGIALNVNMDLKPFTGINPCGYAKMEMTQMSDFQQNADVHTVSEQLITAFLTLFEQ